MILARAVYDTDPFRWIRFEIVALDGAADGEGGDRPTLVSFTGDGDAIRAWNELSTFMLQEPDREWMCSSSVDELSLFGPFHWVQKTIEVNGTLYEVESLVRDDLDLA